MNSGKGRAGEKMGNDWNVPDRPSVLRCGLLQNRVTIRAKLTVGSRGPPFPGRWDLP